MNLRPLLQGWRDWLLLAMCGAWLLTLVWIGHPENDLLKALWSQTMAAWVQAVGSAAAIAFAIWLSDRDRAEARRLDALDRVSALASILSKAEQTMRRPWDDMKLHGWDAYGRTFARANQIAREQTQERCLQVLTNIPLHEMRSWDLASAVMEMIEALSLSAAAFEEVRELNRPGMMYPDMQPLDPSPLAPVVNLAADSVARVHTAAHRLSTDPRARGTIIRPALVA